MTPRLPREFYRRDPVRVARALLGQRLVHCVDGQRLAGLIVETEAYLGHSDKAAHSYGGRRTARNASMYADGGTAYVYFTYGMHYCINAVAGPVDEPVAVLIRGLEPTEGLDEIRTRRPKARRSTDLCSGPARLTQALGVDRRHDGVDLVENDTLFIEQCRRRAYPATRIAAVPRIGIGYAEEWIQRPLRFYLRDNPHISRP